MSRWFRMYDDVINDPKVMRLAPAMRWQWVAVLCVASKNGGAIPPVADLSFALRISEDEAGAILGALVTAGLVDEAAGGEHAPHNWEGRQYKSDVSTSRVKAFRERQRNGDGNVSGNVSSNVSETVDETPPEQKQTQKQKQVSRAIEDRPAAPPSRFEEFWRECPRRDGANPRKPAETRFNSLVKTGLDPQMLIDEAVKWRRAEEGRSKIGTPYVARVTTWLGEQRWSDHAATAALQLLGGEAAQFPIEDAVKMFAKGGYWSRHAGPAPGLSGCKASAELLAQYGLLPDGRKMPPREAA